MKPASLIGAFQLGVALWCALPVQAEPVVFMSTDSPPYWSAQLPDNGYAGSMLNLFSAEAGVDYAIEYLPVKRYSNSNATFIVGDPDLLNDPKHLAIFPIGLFHAAFFFYTPHQAVIEVHSLRNMKGHTLGVLRGSIQNKEDFIRQGVNVEENDSVESLIKKLKRGRIDFCILVEGSGRYMIQKLFPTEQDKFSQVIIPSLTRPIAVMIDVQSPDGKVIAKRYQQVLEKTLHSKKYQSIVEAYYGKNNIPANRDVELQKFIKFYSNTWTN
jgi:polar amino acid transport system substrate-binding protein